MDEATGVRIPGSPRAGGREVALAMDADEFREAGHALVDRLADFLEGIPAGPVTRGESPVEVRAALGGEARMPEIGSDPRALLDRAADLLFEHSLLNGHPRFFGYITSSPAPIGILADMLAAGVNPNVGGWTLSPMATEIEAQAVRWIADLLGFPEGAGGLLVSGGNMANFVAFFAARAAHAGWDVRVAGVRPDGAPRLRVYASAETHTWIQKATDLSGLGTDAIRWIATDSRLRMDMDALRAAIDQDVAAGDRPIMVVGTAGSVSTGVVDPLDAIADLCAERGLWFHVDGAYGGFAAAVPELADIFAGMTRADSIAIDPHKWLYAPLECGCTLVRDPERLRAAFSYHPAYYHFGVEATNFVDFGPQNSRGFRALKVWLGLAQAGRHGYVRMISDDIALSRRMHAAASAHPEIEAHTQELSISTFRHVPPELRASTGEERTESYLNELNRAVQQRIETTGDLFVSNAVLNGRYLLRACIVNFNTTAADVDAVPELVARHGRAVHATLR
jgi:aromatic-L-amino-acid/L-tryptophan decarboxylase